MKSIHLNNASASEKMPSDCRAVTLLHILQEAALIMREVKKKVSGPLEDRIDNFIERVDRSVPNMMNAGCNRLR